MMNSFLLFWPEHHFYTPTKTASSPNISDLAPQPEFLTAVLPLRIKNGNFTVLQISKPLPEIMYDLYTQKPHHLKDNYKQNCWHPKHRVKGPRKNTLPLIWHWVLRFGSPSPCDSALIAWQCFQSCCTFPLAHCSCFKDLLQARPSSQPTALSLLVQKPSVLFCPINHLCEFCCCVTVVFLGSWLPRFPCTGKTHTLSNFILILALWDSCGF